MFELGLDILLFVVSISLLLCFIRLYKGPTTPNRTVAFDLIAIHAVALIVLIAIRYEQPVLLDAAIITAVLGFLGTVVFAHFIEESPFQDEDR
jgi:multicomponent Na+:H+ antiporter subunit F